MKLKKLKLLLSLYIINKLSFCRLFELKRRLLIFSGIECGENISISGKIFILSTNLKIGNNVWIGDSLRIYNSSPSFVTIEDNVDIAPCCKICTGTHEIGLKDRRAGKGYLANITIGTGSWIGINSTIIAGVKIASNTIVGAGSVVVKNVPSDTLVAGIPAVVKKKLADIEGGKEII